MVAPPSKCSEIAENIKTVRDSIATTLKESDGAATEVCLVAVSKSHPADRIRAALEAGHRVFGENRVQEAAEKWPALREEFPQTRLHLIGHLQTNKVRDAVALFDVIETVDRPKLAAALAREMDRSGLRPECLIEINTGEEPQKGGVLPHDADDFIRLCVEEHVLPIQGLMCIPPVGDEPSLHFALLREISRRNSLATLSMGMSADYDIAVRFGATSVRVGTAIFGARPEVRHVP